jgi:hypothetical protein
VVEDQEVALRYVQGVYSLHANAVRSAVTTHALVQWGVCTVD